MHLGGPFSLHNEGSGSSCLYVNFYFPSNWVVHVNSCGSTYLDLCCVFEGLGDFKDIKLSQELVIGCHRIIPCTYARLEHTFSQVRLNTWTLGLNTRTTV